MSGIVGYRGILLQAAAAPPAGPVEVGDPYWANVVLLLHGDGDEAGTVFTDSSDSAHTPSGGLPTVVTAQGNQKFGTAAINFTGGRIYYADHADWDMGSGDFTCEMWFRPSAGSDGLSRYFLGQSSSSNTNPAFSIGINPSQKLFGSASNGAVVTLTGAMTIPVGVFVHAALMRIGNILKLFLNGVQVGSAAFTGTIPDRTTKFAIGADGEYIGASSSIRLAGLVNDFRLTKGVARYTKTFIPPARGLDSYDTPLELWTPVELTNAPNLWLDSDSVMANSGGYVSAWQNRVVSGVAVENSYAPTQPAYVADASAGKPAIRCSTIGARKISAADTGSRFFLKNTGSAWAFAVVKKSTEDVTGALDFAFSVNTNADNMRFCLLLSNVGQLNKVGMGVRRLDANADAYLHDPTARWGSFCLVLITMNYASGMGRVYVNGEKTAENASLTTAGNTSNTNSNRTPSLGGGYSLGTLTSTNVDIAGFLLGSSSLPSDTEIDKLFGWAAHNWGLASELPGAHPYKDDPPYV